MFQHSRYNIGDVLEHTGYGKIFIDSVVWFPVKGFLYTFILPHGGHTRCYERELIKYIIGHAVIGGVVQRSDVPYTGPTFLDSDGIPDKSWGQWFDTFMSVKPQNQANRAPCDVIRVDFKLKKRIA